MPWELKNDRPFYLQLIEKIKNRIIAGKYKPGSKLPSVRDLAEEASVNPNTMQKALIDLERSGLIITNRTSGRSITEDVSLIQTMKLELAKEHLEFLYDQLKKLGFTEEEIKNFILENVR
jgi:DNA-binding transcriptional regulator YhcF (GntR family)